MAIGVITDFRKLKGIGRPALVYAIAQFIIIPPIALLIAWIFHNGMMPPPPM
jgi:predicted Na+-dependent transporter